MTAVAPADTLRRAASQPLPSPPRRSRFLPWLLLAILWGLTTGLLVVGAQVAAVIGS